jgi:hypothetical protein
MVMERPEDLFGVWHDVALSAWDRRFYWDWKNNQESFDNRKVFCVQVSSPPRHSFYVSVYRSN